jgi:hypothetical protein
MGRLTDFFFNGSISNIYNLNGVLNEEGNKVWTNSEGQRHRLDGPAVLYPNGCEYWYQFGHLHRDDGPAVIIPNRKVFWYQYGQRHREDGPAVIYNNRYSEYYIKSVKYSKDSWLEYLRDGESSLDQNIITRLILENI